MMRRILIANRGEIALRVLRACRDLGLSPVIVCSEADRDSLPVRLADAAYPIGPPPAASSYLDIGAIVGAALAAKADAIHPGYGFLAENPEFAEAVGAAGLIFIGPPPEAMRAMGDKVEARRLMSKRGVPVIPGLTERVHDVATLKRFARETGYPIILKAAAGGGGKGMRVVRQEADLAAAYRAARSEAKASFGDDGVYAEKLLESVRHVEIQVLADAHGHAVHLGERECSVQRRHQKLIEEAPSTALDRETRARMGELALEVVKACGYRNAGTVEFLVDAEGSPYFMEVNARLQVEHPVTELVTVVDLVRAQIEVARGEPLTLRQERLKPRGWALECRILAEDPANGFNPSPGRVTALRLPAGPGVRVDTALQPGDEISLHYDALIAKLITWGRDRAQAIARMRRALDEFLVAGVSTTIPFHREALADAEFMSGQIDIAWVDRALPRLAAAINDAGPDAEAAAIAAAVAVSDEAGRAAGRGGGLLTGAPGGAIGSTAAGADSGPGPWTLAGRRALMESRRPRATRTAAAPRD
ncbi:MAG TPA: acetyl-CoA carboxylase biotin carboxylase subunit [Candidatus Polarisedimenticolia bacterium]|nr:acetyl-CoA carboxylase biotin carboxylase subunit [Candidatus Polarisedimenticolia bacterium]